MIGRVVSHYKILSRLGSGGMGVVYKAQDLKLQRPVALKFLPPDLTRDPEAKERFTHEAQAASALDHPNICNIHEIGETDDGQLFIAMACYDGETLRQRIGRGPLTVEEAVSIAIQMAEGLEKAHASGIVHRDIKPANVIITGEGMVKILDFGLAKLGGRTILTRTGSTLGTAAYMSPEQAHGEAVDERTDIWSLGVVLYEMLSGQRPFRGEFESAVIYAILNEDARPVSEFRVDIPQKLSSVIDRCLQKHPLMRPQSCHDIVQDLLTVQMSPETATQCARRTPSIAVLPFLNISGDPENEYFSDGLSEDLINSLTKIRDFRVVARTSAFSFKGKDIDIRDIGRKLSVSTVLEGSVRRMGNRVRITAQLITTEDGYHVWSEQYNRVLDDVFAIQDEITLAIVDKLRVELLGEERSALAKRSVRTHAAYDLYLKGRDCLNKRTEEAMKWAITYFEQALKEDPEYPAAFSGLADSYNLLGAGDYGAMPPHQAFPKAKEAAERALELDNTLAEAHTALGWARTNYDWDWQGGQNSYRRAIELNPGYATAHHWYGIYLSLLGRHAEAATEINKAVELDPLSPIINADIAWVLHRSREYDSAIAQCQKTLSMDPEFSVAHWNLGQSYLQKGMHADAISAFTKAVNLSGGNTVFLASLGQSYAVAGRRKEAVDVLDRLDLLTNSRYVMPHLRAIIYAGLGEKDKALEWLEKAYHDRTDFILEANENPALDSLRMDPRFRSLMNKAGFTG